MESCQVDLIVKFGGSAITVKHDLETPKADELVRAALLMKKCVAAGLRCIVVHGAGSFGHHHAHQYGISKGMAMDPLRNAESRKGFSLTRLSVTKLNHVVCSALVEAGLPAVGHSLCGSWELCDGQVQEHPFAAITRLLDAGFLPVTHGDAVLDRERGCAILSGDTIIKVLSSHLNPKRVVFLSDVAGFFSRPPEQPGAELIEEITVMEDGSINMTLETTQLDVDTTGGIRKKLTSSADIVKHSRGRTVVFLCGVNSSGAETACLEGRLDKKQGTRVICCPP